MKKPWRGAGAEGEIMKYEEIMACIQDINGPWSNGLPRLLPDGNAERRSRRVYPAEGSAGTEILF